MSDSPNSAMMIPSTGNVTGNVTDNVSESVSSRHYQNQIYERKRDFEMKKMKKITALGLSAAMVMSYEAYLRYRCHSSDHVDLE